ncbi:cold shock domain-containing protein [Paralimibaculum aggregatum]|uniref:Cold shock domain-containing protein n=1 Tax=Paralimibaculum aggregatum TaxID=3036245 RepID=A0ABQ6LR16_9RHOB|nr:cold shock domain-containing protein [Limibaculum sp. NKW23]GMG84667.1 cold shock domain-containing protein [Limibaculum sp. NKW23]
MNGLENGAGSVVSGRVKWYDVIKGYGFVVPDAGGPDIMVHASCVRAFGKMALPENVSVRLIAIRGERGLQARELLEVDDDGEAEEPEGFAERVRPTEFLGPDVQTGPLMPARVKWFDKQKGFGFVNVFGHPEDVFVHMETVRRCGFQDLSSGEGMACRTFRGPRGLMVAELRLWEAANDAADAVVPQPSGPEQETDPMPAVHETGDP